MEGLMWVDALEDGYDGTPCQSRLGNELSDEVIAHAAHALMHLHRAVLAMFHGCARLELLLALYLLKAARTDDHPYLRHAQRLVKLFDGFFDELL